MIKKWIYFYLFFKGLGEIFVIRVAGNVIDSIGLGSIEYAVEHLKPLILVFLGHQSCGAVTATVSSNSTTETTPSGDSIGIFFSL